MVCLRSFNLILAFVGITKAQVNLGTALSFGVLGGTTVTNTGGTTISGNVGVSPGNAITGFPPGVVTNGVIHAGDAVANQAQIDLTTAYNAAAAQPVGSDKTGQNLGGQTLTPGVYFFSSSALLTGTLTLDAQFNPNSVWIFQIGSTLTTGSAASVVLLNGARSCNIFWQVGSSATLGTGTTFAGNILALTSITVTTGATSSGSLYARNGAVTLDTNTIIGPLACPVIPPPPSTSTIQTTPSNPSTSSPPTGSTLPSQSTIPSISTLSTSPTAPPSSMGTTGPTLSSQSTVLTIPTSPTTILTSTGATLLTQSTISTNGVTPTAPSTLTALTGPTLNSQSTILTNSGLSTAPSNSTVPTSSLQSTNSTYLTATTVTGSKSAKSSRPTRAVTISRTYVTTISFTATCKFVPTTIFSYGKVFVIKTPCITVLTCMPTITVKNVVNFIATPKSGLITLSSNQQLYPDFGPAGQTSLNLGTTTYTDCATSESPGQAIETDISIESCLSCSGSTPTALSGPVAFTGAANALWPTVATLAVVAALSILVGLA